MTNDVPSLRDQKMVDAVSVKGLLKGKRTSHLITIVSCTSPAYQSADAFKPPNKSVDLPFVKFCQSWKDDRR